MTNLPTATELCQRLLAMLRPQVTDKTVRVGIRTGGEWIADWLHAELGLATPYGSIDASFYRDDLARRGMAGNGRAASIPFEVENAHIIVVDDVLYTGRTIRAALNELFDYGRPARVDLAVLVDRGGRELPVAPTWCAHVMAKPLPVSQTLVLERAEDATLSFRITEK